MKWPFKFNYLLLARAANIDPLACTQDQHLKMVRWASRFSTASKAWARPDHVEAALDDVMKDIRALRRKIEALDRSAVSIARMSVNAEAELKFESDMKAAAGNDDMEQAAMIEFDRATPYREPVDVAALRHLTALEAALVAPTEAAIEKTQLLPPGKGQKPNLAARGVALAAARALIDLTGKPVSYWRGATAFAQLTEALFETLDIQADTRRACEWALSELSKSG